MKKFFQRFGKRISNLIARAIKNFGYICIGISICALIEIGIYWELIGLAVLSLAVTACIAKENTGKFTTEKTI